MDRTFQFPSPERQYETFVTALSDMSTAITTGTTKGYFYATVPMKLFALYATADTAPTTSGITINMKNNGTGILSVKLTIDASKNNSWTSTVQPLIYAPFFKQFDKGTYDIDAIGSGTAGAGVQVYALFYRL